LYACTSVRCISGSVFAAVVCEIRGVGYSTSASTPATSISFTRTEGSHPPLRISSKRTQFCRSRGSCPAHALSPIGIGPGQAPPSIPIVQDAKGFSVEGLRRVSGAFLVGLQYLYATTTLRIDAADDGSEAAPPERDRSLSLASLGVHVEADTRDSTTYPERGLLWNLNADFYDNAVGGDRDFQSYKSALNLYFTMGVRQVLAARVSACDVRGDSPVYTLCLFGTSNDLRGYAVGRYIGRVMLTTQVEYRYNLPERLGFFSKFGFVVFGGVGEVAQTWGALNSSDLLPSGGLGARFLLARENQVNFRVDYAWGKGSHGVYVGVGESF